MNRGYIKLWRKTLDSDMLKNHELWAFWCWCLMRATHKPRCATIGFQEIPLEPGQFIFGRKSAAIELKLTERKIRTCLQHLKNSEKVTIKTTNKFSVISIINWHLYQCDKIENDQQHDQQLTNNRPTTDHKQECKNVRKKEIKKHCASDDALPANGNGSMEYYLTHKKRQLYGKRLDTFNRFWDAFGYKKSRSAAADAWIDIPSLTDALVERIISAARAEAERRKQLIREGRTPKMAQGWISERRWEDEQDEDAKPWWEDEACKAKSSTH